MAVLVKLAPGVTVIADVGVDGDAASAMRAPTPAEPVMTALCATYLSATRSLTDEDRGRAGDSSTVGGPRGTRTLGHERR